MVTSFHNALLAVKRLKNDGLLTLRQVYKTILAYFQEGKMSLTHFLVISSLAVILLLGFQVYLSNFAYVVLMDDQQIGIVQDDEEFEEFLADLTERCGKLYGMEVEKSQAIYLVREYRPDCTPNTDEVRDQIRQKVAFQTDAYMVHVEGRPFAPVASSEVLDVAIEKIKALYSQGDRGTKVLTTSVLEDLKVEPCSVPPNHVLSVEELVSNLSNHEEPEQEVQSASSSAAANRGSLSSRYAYSGDDPVFSDTNEDVPTNEEELLLTNQPGDNNSMSNVNISVKTIEEETLFEEIPFDIERKNDDDLWVVQSEIITEGVEGEKAITYHVTRENGIEVKREKVSKTVLEEPVNQVEAHGTSQVPSKGTGRFLWPVEDGGEITPGRGFSSWHTGIDIDTNAGVNVLAADNGVVWFSGYGGTQGNYLIIYHGSYWTLYLHNQSNLVSEGDEVTKGDVIAKVGTSGRTTGPHLHFEVRRDDGSGEWHSYYQHKPIDPLRFFNP